MGGSSGSTQNPPFNALLFFYRDVLRACLKIRPVWAPGLQALESCPIPVGRVPSRGGFFAFFKQALKQELGPRGCPARQNGEPIPDIAPRRTRCANCSVRLPIFTVNSSNCGPVVVCMNSSRSDGAMVAVAPRSTDHDTHPTFPRHGSDA